MQRIQFKTNRMFTLRTILLFSFSLMAGCATHNRSGNDFIFYPPPPDEPKYQYLTGFSTSADFVTVPPFKLFLMGPPPVFPVSKPYGLAMRNGIIYICDTGYSHLLKADFNTKRLDGMVTIGGGGLLKPINIEIDSQGFFYIADPVRGQIVIYNPEGLCHGFIGNSKDMKPTDVAVSDDRIYIADLKKSGLDVFDKTTRTFLYSIPKEGSGKDAELFSPVNIALGDGGKRIYVSDAGDSRIKEFDSDGNFIKSFGEAGDMPGQFARPRGIAVDRDGRVYVVDAVAEVVQVFDSNGKLLVYFGQPGSPARFALPADIAINYDDVDLFREYIDPDFEVEYLVLVSSQFGLRKVSVFGFGKKKQ